MKFEKGIYGIMAISLFLQSSCSEQLDNIVTGCKISFEIKKSEIETMRSSNSMSGIQPRKMTCNDGNTYYLHTEVSTIQENVSTVMRGTQKAVADLQTDGFKVSAYNSSDGTTMGSAYFEYLTATFADNKFTPQSAGTAKYWPIGKLMFYAYYPAATASNGIVQGSDASELTYTLPSTPANHPDLMTAKLTNQQYTSGDGTAELSFEHALCAIQFQTGNDIPNGTIKSLKLTGIATSGKYNLSTGEWSDKNSGQTYNVTSFSNQTTQTNTENIQIASGENTLMMIPQTLTSGIQRATITFNDGEQDHNLSVDLAGVNWSPGLKIVYTINTTSLVWNYTLTATGNSTTYTGGTVNYNVTSYRTLSTNTATKEPIEWEIMGYSTDWGKTFTTTPPTGFTFNATKGNGSLTSETKTVTIAQNTARTQDQALKNATQIGNSDNYFDLSTHNHRGQETTMNTANTYVVSAPGYYKIPLVYGNAIKNGATNVGAYYQSNSGVSIIASYNTWTASDNRCKYLDKFVDHADAAIWRGNNATDPYIKNHYTPANACLVWQDASGLISNVSYDATGNGFIKFYINPSTITQGNAIIAIRNSSNTILWSWQIWVTPTDIMATVPIKNYQGYTYNMMPVNLGWCAENVASSSYASRNVVVKLRQKKNNNVVGATTTFTLLQFTHSNIAPLGNNSYYQWGRKDPMLGGKSGRYNGTRSVPTNGDKTCYAGSYTRTVDGSDAADDWLSAYSLGGVIQRPHVEFHYHARNWNNQNYINLWNASKKVLSDAESNWYNDDEITKTVYDPSPVGFCVPPSNVFTGFTKTGTNQTTSSEWNISSTANYGIFFKTGFGTNTIYFPCTGGRDNLYNPSESSVTTTRCYIRGSVNSNGYSTSLYTANQTTGNYYTFTVCPGFGINSHVNPHANSGEKGYSFSIRPKTE